MISATPPSPERLVVREEGAAAAAAVVELELEVVVMVLGGVGLMEMVQWWSLKTNYEWEGNQRRRGGESEQEGRKKRAANQTQPLLIVWRRFSTIDGVKKVCQQTALKYSRTTVTLVFTVSVCVRGGGSSTVVILLLRFAPRHQTHAHNIHLVQQHHHSQSKNNHVLTFAAQNMAADRHNPGPGFGDPCAPSAPNTPSVSFHRLGWPPFSESWQTLWQVESKSQPPIWPECLSIYSLLCDPDTVCPHLTRN